jgi:hypothetical protein
MLLVLNKILKVTLSKHVKMFIISIEMLCDIQ